MRLLVLGGTAFLGRAVCEAALARGHEVTSVARGVSGPVAEGARLVRADRDDPAVGLGGVEDEDWDSVLEVSRQPGHVRRAALALASRTGHAVFVSSGNVYADHCDPGADERTPLLPALVGDVMTDMGSYGEAKVACEEHIVSAFGTDRVLVARAGLIGGPGDVSGRSGYWPWRLAHPSNPAGQVLVPATPDAPCQILDVRDLAGWLVGCAERREVGAVNATGETRTFGEVLETAAVVAGHARELVPADPRWLVERGVQEWMGPRSLPLWISNPEWQGFGARSNDRARALGLRPRPLAQTLGAALAFEDSRPPDLPRAAGLTDAEEIELLEDLRRGIGSGSPES